MNAIDKKAATTYLIGSMLQMFLACIVTFVLNISKVKYPHGMDILLLIFGGSSTALWGIIVSLKYKYTSSGAKIIKDFFNILQPPIYYGMILAFLLILYGFQIFTGKMADGVTWFDFVWFFSQAIIFGGIEEIGWRYTWQPILEKSLSFEKSCLLTFLSWALWHYMYFYVTHGILFVNHSSFLVGLLGSCFMLGAIYKVSRSLWLCVLCHCLFNMMSSMYFSNSLWGVLVSNAICILLAIVIVRISDKKRRLE